MTLLWRTAPASVCPDLPDPEARHRVAVGRALAWGLFLGVVAIDWAVASPLSLSLLYGLPLALAAFRLERLEVSLLVVLTTLARVALGPVSGWSVAEHGLRLPVEVEPLANVVSSLLAYSAIAALVFRMRQQEQRLAALGAEVLQDPLTGLGNRRALLRCLERHAGRQVAVLALDLDHFKRVNDAFGHPGGDRALQEVAGRLLASVRGGDCVARSGGEEFLVVLAGESEAGARRVAERIVERMREAPFCVGSGGERVALTLSIGLAAGAADLALVEAADRALYRAKAAGRDRIERAAAAEAAA
ncbi:GGDEF domain-containing protein [Aggregicoccus sp. 17bor-14]|uniref:GGDEF domain-containing protein n=1 Tax=Myxococcaceae TaxID=31 RepID=UPI00129CD357|nr:MULTISPECIES: GGDEF domain-containing protein [Myxococcaceae]MBF5045795.1 GGDEF domain-containing protein [Simulacricoccus sp. 17bor-14]MRI91530.1 GGDEF domain-containing protein [Aggregicoccus sp. 17bor-14]